MKLSDIAGIIKSMKGRMPESSRSLLAHRFVKLFGENLTNAKDGGKLQEWVESGGVAHFLNDCELLSGQPWVNHEIAVHDSDLATFINRWMNIDKFRKDANSEFKPITPDMHAIRSMMVEELKGLYEAQRRVSEHERESNNRREGGV